MNNMSQNRIFSSLFFCYALNLLFKKFLGAYKMCVFLLHKYMSSKKLVFKILRSFHFFPFYIKGNWVLHDFVGLCLPKYISPETFCCLSFFVFFFDWFISLNNEHFGLQNVTFFCCCLWKVCIKPLALRVLFNFFIAF